MPGTVSEKSLKRKQPKSLEKANKRAKAESDDEDDNSTDDILRLEQEILESKKNYNNITTILELAQNEEDGDTAQFALVSLCRVFLRLLASGNFARKSGQSEKDEVVIQWLRKRLGDYKRIIVSSLGQEDAAPTALTLAMRVLQAEGKYMKDKDEYNFPTNFLREIVDELVRNGSEDIRQEFCEKFLGEYADIRFYTFKVLK